MLHAVADAMADARWPVVRLGQGDYTRDWPAKEVQVERDTLETIVRREREDFQDDSDSLTDDAIRELIRQYTAAGSDECLIIVARTIADGEATRLVQAMTLALYAELQRRAGK